MIRRALAAAVLALALAAPVAQGETLPEVEAAVAAGYAAWGQTTAPGCQGGVIVAIVPVGSLAAADNGALAAGRGTIPDGRQAKPCVIQIVDNLRPCELRGIAEHEVGHTLGLGHLPAPSIMAADGSGGSYYCAVEDLVPVERRFAAHVAQCRVAPPGWTRAGACWANARRERAEVREVRAELPPPPTFP